MAEITLPVMLPSPPITTISRMKYVTAMVNVVDEIAPIYIAISAPPIPEKNELITNDSSLCRVRLMPIASAAISSSRIALNARPYVERISSAISAMHTITTTKIP